MREALPVERIITFTTGNGVDQMAQLQDKIIL